VNGEIYPHRELRAFTRHGFQDGEHQDRGYDQGSRVDARHDRLEVGGETQRDGTRRRDLAREKHPPRGKTGRGRDYAVAVLARPTRLGVLGRKLGGTQCVACGRDAGHQQSHQKDRSGNASGDSGDHEYACADDRSQAHTDGIDEPEIATQWPRWLRAMTLPFCGPGFPRLAAGLRMAGRRAAMACPM
jgi:hypothetical protein